MAKIELSNEHKLQVIDSIQVYFKRERDEDLGILAAELVLDFMMEKIGPVFYNQGITDANTFMNEKVDDLFGLCI